jgi:hypothetical protein
VVVAAAAVSMAGIMRLALNDSAVLLRPMTVDEKGKNEGEEEEYAVPTIPVSFRPHWLYNAPETTHMMPNAKQALSIAHHLLGAGL